MALGRVVMGPFSVLSQGHVHVESVVLCDRRPGLRRWYIETQQKRPNAFVAHHENRMTVLLDGHDSLYLRDGEDGSIYTSLTGSLPWTFPWRTWSLTTWQDKWGVEITAHTTSWPMGPRWVLRDWWRQIKRRRVR